MAEQPRSVRAFICDAGFLDVGTTKDYVAATPAGRGRGRLGSWTPGRRFTVAPDARVERTIVWDDVTVGAGAVVLDSILADGVSIPPGARYDHCAIVRAAHLLERGLAPRDERLDGDLLVAPISRLEFGREERFAPGDGARAAAVRLVDVAGYGRARTAAPFRPELVAPMTSIVSIDPKSA